MNPVPGATVTRRQESESRTRSSLVSRYEAVRAQSRVLTETLEPEDFVVQSMPDVSPTKWHLAHTSWFFETFLLLELMPGYRPFRPEFSFVFNSYYNTVGPQHLRPERGLLTRPTVREVFAYREHVDAAMRELFDRLDEAGWEKAAPLLELGLQHEQQHQELILTDIKHVFASSPLNPVYRSREQTSGGHPGALAWVAFDEGLVEIGHEGTGFAFDNEAPRHQKLVGAFDLASRLVTNGEYLRFLEDRGYERHEFWLSDAWARVREEKWAAPLYWRNRGGEWREMTLAGERELGLDEPVCHVSFYEADAYARWAGARLPSEEEWETAASGEPIEGNLVESGRYHPAPAGAGSGLRQLYGDVWEWTQSPYVPYPRFRPPEGALGEYNAKFMVNQLVLRGGSCATPGSHVRLTYRNFFPAHARWQFSGVRLARDGNGSAS